MNILSDRLPAFAPVQDQNSWLDSLSASLTDAGVTFIDVRSTFKDHKMEDSIITLIITGLPRVLIMPILRQPKIWELILQQTLMTKHLSPVLFREHCLPKAVSAPAKKDEIDVFLPTGDQALSSVVNYVDEQKKSASFYDTEKLETRDKYALFFGGNHAQIKISTPTETDNTLLVLKDSYANSFIPFLAQHYRKIIMIDPPLLLWRSGAVNAG